MSSTNDSSPTALCQQLTCSVAGSYPLLHTDVLVYHPCTHTGKQWGWQSIFSCAVACWYTTCTYTLACNSFCSNEANEPNQQLVAPIQSWRNNCSKEASRPHARFGVHSHDCVTHPCITMRKVFIHAWLQSAPNLIVLYRI